MTAEIDASAEWDAHQAKHGYTDEQVERLGAALYDAGLTEVFNISDEDCELAARIFLSIPTDEQAHEHADDACCMEHQHHVMPHRRCVLR